MAVADNIKHFIRLVHLRFPRIITKKKKAARKARMEAIVQAQEDAWLEEMQAQIDSMTVDDTSDEEEYDERFHGNPLGEGPSKAFEAPSKGSVEAKAPRRNSGAVAPSSTPPDFDDSRLSSDFSFVVQKIFRQPWLNDETFEEDSFPPVSRSNTFEPYKGPDRDHIDFCTKDKRKGREVPIPTQPLHRDSSLGTSIPNTPIVNGGGFTDLGMSAKRHGNRSFEDELHELHLSLRAYGLMNGSLALGEKGLESEETIDGLNDELSGDCKEHHTLETRGKSC